VKDDMRAL